MTTIDVDDENILTTIFKDSFPGTWKDTPDFAQYLAELSSFGVDKLGREPERLAEERAQILEQTQELAFHNYKTFIQTAECSRDIFQDFQIIEQHVEAMLEKLPVLTEECNSFIKKANQINTSRQMNKLTLQRHTQLLEILEIPQLMDTCVRNGYYEEALELAAHVKRLEKKHSSIAVIMNIVNEVRGSTQLMLNQLIQQLRTNIQLPACLRVIGYLRRMDCFTEAELRIKFLQARDAWFESILHGIPSDDPYYHISKIIEASRVHLFDIITQYRAIFSDEDPLLSSKQDAPNENALFNGWVVQKVSQFLQILEYDVQRGIGGRLDSLLGQCMYFGLSFSRVGADFRGLLAPIFQRAALRGFKQCMEEAYRKFQETMDSYTLLGATSVLPSSTFNLATQSSTGQLNPPTNLLQFHPLAAYCNDILSSFNDLRLCAPLSLAIDVAAQLQASLNNVVKIILAFHRAEESTFNQQELEIFGKFCLCFAEDLVPYLNKCLQVLFPPAHLAQTLGLPVLELAKMGTIGTVDSKAVIEPMEHLLPIPEEEPEPEPEPLKEDQPLEQETSGETNEENIDKPPAEQVDATPEEGHEPSNQSGDDDLSERLSQPDQSESSNQDGEKHDTDVAIDDNQQFDNNAVVSHQDDNKSSDIIVNDDDNIETAISADVSLEQDETLSHDHTESDSPVIEDTNS